MYYCGFLLLSFCMWSMTRSLTVCGGFLNLHLVVQFVSIISDYVIKVTNIPYNKHCNNNSYTKKNKQTK